MDDLPARRTPLALKPWSGKPAGEWLRVLKDDRRAIFTAAAHAQRAVDYLVLRPGPTAGPCGRHN
jgi:antirestriction protein ArdC